MVITKKLAKTIGLILASVVAVVVGLIIWFGFLSPAPEDSISFASDESEASIEASLEEPTDYNLVVNEKPFANMPIREYAEGTIVVPILMYHHIQDPPAGAKPSAWQLHVSPGEFDRQMKYLYLSSHNVVSLDNVLTALAGGEQLPENPVVITFDDLYQSQIDSALPVLSKYGFKATFFVCVACAQTKVANVRAVLDAGHEIGSHSFYHKNVAKLKGSALRKEIGDSKSVLASRYGVDVKFFAYPGCSYSAVAERMVEEYGYLGAVTCVTPYNGQTYDGRFHLARRLIDNDYDKFVARLEDREGMW